MIFNLPDLGEGLPDAEIHQWFVKEGEEVDVDQPLVAMETAKAVVDVPSPHKGVISKLHGQPGDVIKTGEPLVSFESTQTISKDQGTVVGSLEEHAEVSEDQFIIGSQQGTRPKATPNVRLLAKKLDIDLNHLQGTGLNGVITLEDVRRKHDENAQIPEGFEPLRGVRKAMLRAMVHAHQEIVPVSLFDQADLHCWAPDTDITVRLIQAIVKAASKEPCLNAWFNTQHSARKCFKEVHLGLAMDNEEGLFVPVIHNAHTLNSEALRQKINQFKDSVATRAINPEQLTGATISLSNFGKFSGRFASPIIVPPMVAIIGVGKIYKDAVVTANNQVESHPILPLSLSFDHRAVTGGEATRFLGYLIECLEQP